MHNELVIETKGICHSYARGVNTLHDINLRVNRGDVYGFLGPNGSGKTTTLSLLLGLLPLQKGSIHIFGKPVQHHRSKIFCRIGSLIEAPSLYTHLSASENLEVYRKVYGASKARVQEVLQITGLPDTGKKIVRRFSLGMKQRLSLALALLPKPELMILDEPTNGLDPAGIVELREMIIRLNKEEGITFIISSHILAEVEKMVNRLGIIYKGKLVFQGSLEDLKVLYQKQTRLVLHTSNNEMALSVLRSYFAEKDVEGISVPLHSMQQVADINRVLLHHNLDVYLLQPQKEDLEKLFIDLTTQTV